MTSFTVSAPGYFEVDVTSFTKSERVAWLQPPKYDASWNVEVTNQGGVTDIQDLDYQFWTRLPDDDGWSENWEELTLAPGETKSVSGSIPLPDDNNLKISVRSDDDRDTEDYNCGRNCGDSGGSGSSPQAWFSFNGQPTEGEFRNGQAGVIYEGTTYEQSQWLRSSDHPYDSAPSSMTAGGGTNGYPEVSDEFVEGFWADKDTGGQTGSFSVGDNRGASGSVSFKILDSGPGDGGGDPIG
jgi:hypothetical protein